MSPRMASVSPKDLSFDKQRTRLRATYTINTEEVLSWSDPQLTIYRTHILASCLT
jgi:uncharacterized protein